MKNTKKFLQLIIMQDIVLLSHPVWNVLKNELQLDRQALGVRSVEHREIRKPQVFITAPDPLDRCGDHLGFRGRSSRLDDLDRSVVRAVSNRVLFNSPLIVADQASGVIDDIAGTSIVAFEFKALYVPAEMLFQFDNVPRRAPAEGMPVLPSCQFAPSSS